MSLLWWSSRDPEDDVESQGTPKPERDRASSSTNRTTPVPGSPSIVFLSRPVVVEKKAGEKTGLLPPLNR